MIMAELLAYEHRHWREKGLDITLRLPFLFLIDEKLKSDFPSWVHVVDAVEKSVNLSDFFAPLLDICNNPLIEKTFYYLKWFSTIIILYSLTFATSTKDLMLIYSHLGSVILPLISMAFNESVINSDKSHTDTDILFLGLQLILAWMTSKYCVPGIKCLWGKPLYFIFTLPTLFSLFEFPKFVIDFAFGSSSLLVSLSCASYLSCVYDSYLFFEKIYFLKGDFIHVFGINAFLEAEWTRLNVPVLLRTFWLIRFMCNVGEYIYTNPFPEEENMDIYTLELGKFILIKGCETFWAVLGMAAILSSLCQLIDCLFRCILSVDDSAMSRTVASVSPFLFFVLALQTGLTTLEPDKRLSRLLMNLCLLLTAIFHLVHDMVAPVLISLTISQNYDSRKHLRALSTCVFLIGSALSLLLYLWDSFSCGTWLFAVSAFCIEVIIKIFISLLIYCLYLYDQFGNENWEKFDDVVYYVKAVGNSIEFFFAVCLFINGGWIFFFESRGAVRAMMMGIHAYFNIWCEAINGWESFRKRRTASTKLSSLVIASERLVKSRNDVCAICLMEMKVARVTSCDHLFHSHCLQRWIYVENTCPLCKTVLFGEDGALLQLLRHSFPSERLTPSSPVHVNFERDSQSVDFIQRDVPSSDEDEIIYDAVDNYDEDDDEDDLDQEEEEHNSSPNEPLIARLRIRN
ncbi:protein TRC8 homolog [Lepeophtheirus salmonis]|uniref:RING-type domain-containing protein n=1 Tax=Lepeophtheirus salmonis TaxID=72036 RepID=A0A0K2TMF7_LEPSM|nr:protein TRC8 homolog [Lepeophtheirus salmonis]